MNRPASPPDPTTVAIVLDPAFGSDLVALARRAAVWVVDSPVNRPVVQSLWSERRRGGTDCEVAVFRQVPELSTEDHLAAVMRSLGPAVHGPAYPASDEAVVEVFGLAASGAIEARLRLLGFGTVEPTPAGFLARRDRRR